MEIQTTEVEIFQDEELKKAEFKSPSKLENNPVMQKDVTVKSSQTLMAVIEKVAALPELDMDRVERLFQMNERMLERQSESEYNIDLSKAQSEMQSVSANKKNDHTGSTFANLDAVHEVCKPIWTRHGFSVCTTLKPSAKENHVTILCEVRHSGGFKQIYENDWPLDLTGTKGTTNKTTIQAIGSTASYARRYSELMIFDIAIKREDNDGNGVQQKVNPAAQPLTQAHLNNLRKAMEAAGVDEAYVCQKAQIDCLGNLQQGRLQGCINHLKSIAQGQQQ